MEQLRRLAAAFRTQVHAPTLAAPAVGDDAALVTLVERERMRQHARGNVMSALSGFLPLTYTALVLKGLVPGGPLLIWCVALAVADLVVAGHAASYFLRPRPEHTWHAWRVRLTVLLAVKGLLWGVPAIWMPISPEVKMYVYAILSAVQSAGMMGIMQYHPPVIVFSVSTWTVTLTSLLSGAVGFDTKLTAGIPVLLISMNFYMWESTNQLVRGLYARFHADTLNTELGQQVATNHELATRDDLTGLFNRREGMARLAALHDDWTASGRAPAQAYAVMVLDVDHFKRINDEYGHPIGDEVLRTVADRFRAGLRASDVVARVGGEEFMVLILAGSAHRAGSTATITLSIAEQIRQEIRATPISTTTGPIPITISIGIAVSSSADEPPDVYARADRALYAAKTSGRDRVQVLDDASSPGIPAQGRGESNPGSRPGPRASLPRPASP